MKLLILTCLVAAALAMPRLHHKSVAHIQTQLQDNSEEQQEFVKQPQYLTFNEKFINGLNRQREILTGKQSDEIKLTMDESTKVKPFALNSTMYGEGTTHNKHSLASSYLHQRIIPIIL
ncbi:alpha-S1-casein [Peromyscus leucopus]|uniref:alpha-S1-casein n=1 Tax=Peromyscus leucopus TaxID=10041 RepID=UPI001884E457|nr:alpha-S1-casein [Peromyscus leucopus]